MTKYEPVIDQWFQHKGRYQRVWKFPNGYGVSAIKGPETRSGSEFWTLAVLKYHGGGILEYDLCYDTDVTPRGDVLLNIKDEEVDDLVKAVAELAPAADAHLPN